LGCERSAVRIGSPRPFPLSDVDSVNSPGTETQIEISRNI
jgi:hypothetical protein